MKALILTISTFLIIVRDTLAQDDGISLYSRRYERLDIDTILASPRLVTNYVDCLLSKKPCPPEGKALKRILPEALRTKCGRCWPSQKEGALKVITALYYDYPQHFMALRERWDPSGEYNRRFEEYLRDQKFNVINSNGGQDSFDQADPSQATQRPIRQDTTSIRTTFSTTTTTTITTTASPSSTTPKTVEASISSINNGTFVTSSQEPLAQASGVAEVANRFGAPDEEVIKVSQSQNSPSIYPTTQRYPIPTTQRYPIPERTTRYVQQITRAPTTKRTQRIPQNHGFNTTPKPLPGFQTHPAINTNNPILNIFNHLTLKVANTAELLTGMLHGATTQEV